MWPALSSHIFVTLVNLVSIDMTADLHADCSTYRGQSGFVIVGTEAQAFLPNPNQTDAS